MLALAMTACSGDRGAKADLIVTNATIYTVDESAPKATALAVSGDRVLYVGDSAGASAYRDEATKMLDAGGATMVPGIVDAHAHLAGLGAALRSVDLVGTPSYDSVIARVVERARETPAGQWITGRGWDQNDWPNTDFPTNAALSKAVPNNPVFLERVDGHAALANAAALEAANVTAATRDPEGGRILRLPNGNPSGVLVDRATGLVESAIPPTPDDELRKQILAAIDEVHRWGLIGIHDAGEPRRLIDLYEDLAREDSFELRNYVMVSGTDTAAVTHYLERGPQNGLYDGHIWIRAIKLYADGALGSRGAALLEPYSDDPDQSGLLLTQKDQIRDVAVRALRGGFQVNVHAIGDRGNRTALDAFEEALNEVPTEDHRFRIEHAQILSPQDIPRFAELGVIPSMQASHQTSDMYWAEERVGPERIKGAYAWRSLLNTGVVIPNGTDFPVESVSPIITFHSAVSRQDAKNWPPGGWYPEQKMTREEALESLTLWPAHAAFQDSVMGSLTPGKYADFVLLDRDIMTVPDSAILGTRVIATYLGGREVYRDSTQAQP
jgi:predicted amidohydrolase YtcJ